MKQIAAKLVKVMGDIDYIKNDSTNNEQHYKYASDEAVLNEVRKAMVKNNVASKPKFIILSDTEGKSNSGKSYNKVEMECQLTVIDADSGEHEASNGFGCGIDYGGDKALMKAQTASHKYAFLKLFNIPTGDNPEDDTEVDKEAKKGKPVDKPSASKEAENPTTFTCSECACNIPENVYKFSNSNPKWKRSLCPKCQKTIKAVNA